MTYEMDIAGLKRELPLCKVADDLYIGAFVMFGDVELTVHCASELLKRPRLCVQRRPAILRPIRPLGPGPGVDAPFPSIGNSPPAIGWRAVHLVEKPHEGLRLQPQFASIGFAGTR